MGRSTLKRLKKRLAEEAEKVASLNSRAAQIGSRIPGSKLIRDFCACCGEPIRVVCISKNNVCLDCTRSPNDFGGCQDRTAEHDIRYHGNQFYSGEW
jgi:hypothetical protein